MKNIYHTTTKRNLSVFDEFAENDIRLTPDFQIFVDKVFEKVKQTKAQTWRQLAESFPDRYRLNLAVDSLTGLNQIRIDESKPISVIRFGGRETLEDICARLGHNISAVKANIDVYCLRCGESKKNWRKV